MQHCNVIIMIAVTHRLHGRPRGGQLRTVRHERVARLGRDPAERALGEDEHVDAGCVCLGDKGEIGT